MLVFGLVSMLAVRVKSPWIYWLAGLTAIHPGWYVPVDSGDCGILNSDLSMVALVAGMVLLFLHLRRLTGPGAIPWTANRRRKSLRPVDEAHGTGSTFL